MYYFYDQSGQCNKNKDRDKQLEAENLDGEKKLLQLLDDRIGSLETQENQVQNDFIL